jgi:uncharacterized protein YecE (DUF72 family)
MAIRVGIGGWTYAPWRGTFYPKGLKQADELHFASRAVTAIEINGTFYGSQKPASFRKWRDESPDDFVFALKGPRFAVNRRVLAESGDSVARFFASGVSELGDKLGPINWQLAATKKFDPDDIAAFLDLLPKSVEGVAIRHVIEARHESFRDPAFIALARKHGVAIVLADSDDYPAIADVTADFVYARLQRAEEKIPTGYADATLAKWASRAKTWAAGGEPDDLDRASDKKAAKKKRDVFIFMINGAKVRAPAAAMALIERLKK